ncbi:MAG: acylphosphatase [Pseudanabaenales cyanobacterium]|nr:acylphosphatase [Pseudanabaenales cyanobacterium]
MKRCKIIVHGLVQGVGFRFYTRAEAQRLHVNGYVKNKPNSTVEIVAEGSSENVQALVQWAKQGPPSARVSNIELIEDVEISKSSFEVFAITY